MYTNLISQAALGNLREYEINQYSEVLLSCFSMFMEIK